MVASIGGQVAGYRLDALVGRGGGGVVYRATHLHLGRTVALKLLAPELAADQDFQRRFEREARTAGALDHPHIVPVYDAGDADGVLYLAMRFVEGRDLASIIETAGGRLDLDRTCAILSQVASALDAGHAKGLVHRDVKPANILIDHVTDRAAPEHAYLSDFGLARRFEGTALSRTMVAGTPSFMAPERFRGVAAAPAIDVYALGCVAYACLIGSPPFGGDSIESVMAGHLYEEPPKISDRRADLPPGTDAVLAKAIAKEPADRYPSCGAFAGALRDVVQASAIPVRPAQSSPAAAGFDQTTVPPPAKPMAPTPTPLLQSVKNRKRFRVAAIIAVAAVALIVLGMFGIGWPFGTGQPSAVDTRLAGPVYGLAVDPTGGLYFSTLRDTRIFKLDQSGTIRTVAGTGTKGDSGDNGPASNAQFASPRGLAADRAGNLYISDYAHHRVRKVDSTETIVTVAGNGTPGSAGDNGPAIVAQLQNPDGLAVGSGDDLYVAESSGDRVRKIDRYGVITTVAGTGEAGFSGDGGPATQAKLDHPRGIAVDAAGNLYIADTGNGRIRKVDVAGRITTVAGNGKTGYDGDGRPAVAAQLDNPRSVAVDRAGNIFIADSVSHRIRKVDLSGRISTIAGNGLVGFSGDGGFAIKAQLAFPDGVAVDQVGNVYIGDHLNYRVRKVDLVGIITTVAGSGPAYPGDGGPATQAAFSYPKAVFVNKDGVIYVADSFNHRVRRVGSGGEITTIAGTGIGGFSGDGGLAANAQLNEPTGVILDPAGNIFIADMANHRVRKVTPDGKISTVIGIGVGSYSAGDNGPATAADVSYPIGLAIGGDQSLYITEGANDRVRRVDPAGIITTVAGTGRGFSGDGGPAGQAKFASPAAICFDRLGNLFLADRINNRIRKIDPAGIITTVAGNGAPGFSGDGAPARDAQLNSPSGVAVDGTGNLYIADINNNRVRKVDTSGKITTIAGTGLAGISGDHGPAVYAMLDHPFAVNVGADGAVYITDMNNQRIRRVDPAGAITTVVGPDSSDGN